MALWLIQYFFSLISYTLWDRGFGASPLSLLKRKIGSPYQLNCYGNSNHKALNRHETTFYGFLDTIKGIFETFLISSSRTMNTLIFFSYLFYKRTKSNPINGDFVHNQKRYVKKTVEFRCHDEILALSQTNQG